MRILEMRCDPPMSTEYLVNVVIEHEYYMSSGSRRDAISTLELSGEKDIIEEIINGDSKIEFFDLMVARVVGLIYKDLADSEINNLVFIMKNGQLFKRKDDIPIIEDRITYYQDKIKNIEKRIIYSDTTTKLCRYMDIVVGHIVLNKNESKIQATVPVKVNSPNITPLKMSTLFPKFDNELIEDIYKRYLKY